MLNPVRPTSPSGLAVLRRVTVAYLAAVGTITVGLPWVVPHGGGSYVAHTASGIAMLACALVLVLDGRASRATIEALAMASLGPVGVLVWMSDPLTVEPWLVLGPAVLLAGFSAGSAVVTGLVLTVVSLGLGVLLRDPALPRFDVLLAPSLVAGVLALLVHRLVPSSPEEHDDQSHGTLLDPARLHGRLDALTERSIARGEPLSLALVAPTGAPDPAGIAEVGQALAGRSREDDVLAVLPDAVAVVLPGAGPAAAIVYAARATVVAGQVASDGAVAGIGPVIDAADGADVLLRRARRALRAAHEAGPGHLAVHGPDGSATHVAADVAAVPGSGGRQH